jgi:ATP-binding cassette subfamily B protein
MMQPVEQLGFAVQAFSQGTALLAKLMELFQEEREPGATQASASAVTLHPLSEPSTPVTDPYHRHRKGKRVANPDEESIEALDETAGPGRLEFDRVSHSYRYDRPLLTDVSFLLPAGNTLGVVGPSGSGKSTIVRLLVRLFEADAGQILLDGVPTSKLSLESLRRAVAVVPQDTILFNDTIGYNIGFGKYGTTQAEIEKAARIAHLHDFIMSLPDQYDTRVGERGVKLSGGEKQRVSIARAALKHPRIYVFDEATSSLDSHSESEILHNLRELSRFCTTLIIAHRLSTVVHADEIAVLESGTFVERGTHTALLGKKARYAKLWEAQQRGSVAAA